MSFFKNTFAAVGVLSVAAVAAAFAMGADITRGWDPKAGEVLTSFAERYATTDLATAAVVRIPVDDGLSPDDVVDSMKLRANMRNIKLVGEKPLHQQIEAIDGTPYRYTGIFEFCDAATAKEMLEYNPDYVAFMPCRIALFSDREGKYWLSTMNMDLLIHGGKELHPELKAKAVKVREGLMDIMQAGAKGEL